MIFEKSRTRRIILNDDANPQCLSEQTGYPYEVTDSQSFLDSRLARTFDTQVDTYVYCVDNGADPAWGAFHTPVWPFLGSEERAAGLIVDACHARGMEVWASLRMNDIHDAWNCTRLEDSNDPLKAEHPEYVLGKPEDRRLPDGRIETGIWTAWNYARPEVRQYRLDYIKRTAAAHDWDGYELDFGRWPWCFPLGSEIEMAPLMTAFVRECRATLDSIADKRGRPYTLVAHVVDSPRASSFFGQDVEAWLADGLIDVLVPGTAGLPMLGIDEWVALGSKYGVPVCPSIDTLFLDNRYEFCRYEEGLKRITAWQQAIRAAAALWWADGAQGIYLFNFFCEDRDESVKWPANKHLVTELLTELGDPAKLTGRDKLYAVRAAGPGNTDAARPALLPVPLQMSGRKLPLQMGPDADDPRARFRIHVWTTGGDEDTRIWGWLNHGFLELSLRGDHYVADVPAGIMRSGNNEISLSCTKDISPDTRPYQVPSKLSASPMIVYEILVDVKY